VLPEPVPAPSLPVPAAPAILVPQETATPDELPALTLEDVKHLTTESDFSPFVARGVAPDIRNAAMKKLFTDPHYNVMDRLDIYIDDYSQPDPLPESMLRQMVSARFLKLFDEPSDKKSADAGDDANTQTATNLPQSASTALDHSPPHAHADLRLQQDPARVRPALASDTGSGGPPDPDPAQHPVPP
jgi:hypothetical protein